MADNDNFHAPAHDLPEETQPAADSAGNATEAPPPERLRVHSLARVLGTTSRRIIDALVELDGRARAGKKFEAETEPKRRAVDYDGRLSRAGGHGGAVGEERVVDVVPLGRLSFIS